jgi:hypothetical protein
VSTALSQLYGVHLYTTGQIIGLTRAALNNAGVTNPTLTQFTAQLAASAGNLGLMLPTNLSNVVNQYANTALPGLFGTGGVLNANLVANLQTKLTALQGNPSLVLNSNIIAALNSDVSRLYTYLANNPNARIIFRPILRALEPTLVASQSAINNSITNNRNTIAQSLASLATATAANRPSLIATLNQAQMALRNNLNALNVLNNVTARIGSHPQIRPQIFYNPYFYHRIFPARFLGNQLNWMGGVHSGSNM